MRTTMAARVLRTAVACAIALWACGVVVLISTRQAGGPSYEYWLETTISDVLITPVVILLVLRRPDHRLTWLFAGFTVVGSVQLTSGATTVALTASRPDVASWVMLLHDTAQLGFVILLLALVLLYPTGHLPSRRWWPVALLLSAGGTVTAATSVLAPRLDNFPTLANPIGTTAAVVSMLAVTGAVMVIAAIAGAVAAPIVRYRRSHGLERLQLKWFTFMVVVGVVLLAGVGSLLPDSSVLGSVLWTFVPSAILASIGLAVFRYRLLEIDRIISRTVSYSVVSALLAALYAVAVFVLTPIIATAGGDSGIAVAAATLLVAAAFGPVRRRVQTQIDRHFNRARYDTLRTVDAFAARLRDDVDLEQLTDRFVDVVAETVAPQRVSLWLAPSRTGLGESP